MGAIMSKGCDRDDYAPTRWNQVGRETGVVGGRIWSVSRACYRMPEAVGLCAEPPVHRRSLPVSAGRHQRDQRAMPRSVLGRIVAGANSSVWSPICFCPGSEPSRHTRRRRRSPAAVPDKPDKG